MLGLSLYCKFLIRIYLIYLFCVLLDILFGFCLSIYIVSWFCLFYLLWVSCSILFVSNSNKFLFWCQSIFVLLQNLFSFLHQMPSLSNGDNVYLFPFVCNISLIIYSPLGHIYPLFACFCISLLCSYYYEVLSLYITMYLKHLFQHRICLINNSISDSWPQCNVIQA